MLALLPFPAPPPECPGELALRLSKYLVSDALGLKSTKSRKTAGVIDVVVLFSSSNVEADSNENEKNYPLDKQNNNFALASRFLFIFFFFFST